MGSVQEDGTFSYTPYEKFVGVRNILTFARTAEHTVALSIAILICHGIICSFPSKTLNQLIRWFAPINSEYLIKHDNSYAHITTSSRLGGGDHRSSGPYR
jgi:hypothetical protein